MKTTLIEELYYECMWKIMSSIENDDQTDIIIVWRKVHYKKVVR